MHTKDISIHKLSNKSWLTHSNIETANLLRPKAGNQTQYNTIPILSNSDILQDIHLFTHITSSQTFSNQNIAWTHHKNRTRASRFDFHDFPVLT